MKKKRWRCSAAAGALCVLVLVASVPVLARGEKKKPKATSNYALLFGSVFHENGFLVRGAKIVVTDLDHPKEKKQTTTTDLQGEFAVRLPAGKARYEVEVSAEGLSPDRKTVEVAGDERVDLTFHLAQAAK
jgi:hypothetical protein